MISSKHQIYFKRWQLDKPIKDLETHSSFLYWCHQNGRPVVLKIYKPHSNEAISARLLAHYNCHGAVEILAHEDDACLLAQVGDGRELVELTRANDDGRATEILCEVIQRLHNAPAKNIGLVPVDDFLADFDKYLTQTHVPERELVIKARVVYADLSASQSKKLNLHGDLHHYNVIQSTDGDWLAIDPKGFWGEVEYELGSLLRNPLDDDFKNIDMQRRFEIIEARLGYDMKRVQQWAFCQAVLASIWGDDDIVFGARMVKVMDTSSG